MNSELIHGKVIRAVAGYQPDDLGPPVSSIITIAVPYDTHLPRLGELVVISEDLT